MGRYVALLLWPAHLSADYSFSQIPLANGSVGDWLAWTVIVTLAIVTLAAVRVNRIDVLLSCGCVHHLPAGRESALHDGNDHGREAHVSPVCIPPGRQRGCDLFAGDDVWNSLARSRCLEPGDCSLRSADICQKCRLVRRPAAVDGHRANGPGQLQESRLAGRGAVSGRSRAQQPPSRHRGKREEPRDPAGVIGPGRPATAVPRWRKPITWKMATGFTRTRPTSSDVAKAYKRAAELGERYLALAAAHQVPAREISDAQLLVSTAYNHLDQSQRALESARRAAADQPFNPVAYRDITVALLNVNRLDDAAVELMTGFMVTGDEELRRVLIALYRNGLDAAGCATTVKDGSASLNVSCEIVRRHLCAAAARATAVATRQRPSGACGASLGTSRATRIAERQGRPEDPLPTSFSGTRLRNGLRPHTAVLNVNRSRVAFAMLDLHAHDGGQLARKPVGPFDRRHSPFERQFLESQIVDLD